MVTCPDDAVRFPIWVGPQDGAVLIKAVPPAPAVTATFVPEVILIVSPEVTRPIVPVALIEILVAD
jgi:hypothetical protein